MDTRAVVIAVVLAQLGLAGCFGANPDAEGLTAAGAVRPAVSSSLGAVAGVVTTQAIEPLREATVTVLELEKKGKTSAEGSYAINLLRPGEYAITAVAPGYKSLSRTVAVMAGGITWVNFTLPALDATDPYVVHEEFRGYTSCAAALMLLYSTGGCDEANDKLEYYTKADVDLRAIVGEMTWSTQDRLTFSISEHPDPQGDPTGINKRSYGRLVAQPGENYLRLHLTTGVRNEDQGGTLPLPPPNATYEYGTRTFYVGHGADESTDAWKQACSAEPTGLVNSTARRCTARFGGLGATTAVPYQIVLTTFYIEPGPADYALLKP